MKKRSWKTTLAGIVTLLAQLWLGAAQHAAGSADPVSAYAAHALAAVATSAGFFVAKDDDDEKA